MKKIIYISFIFAFALIACKGGKDTQSQKRPPQDEFRVTFHEAIQEKMRGNLDVSALLFEKCLTYDDESDAVHYALSDIYQKLGDQKKSEEHAIRAFELDNQNRWYQLHLANMYFAKGNYHKSAEYFAISIEEEKNIDVKFKYTEALLYSNQYKKAIAMMDEIEVETGKVPNLSLTKHDMYMQLGDPENAAREVDVLLEENPSNIEYRIIVADYFLRTQQLPKAEKYTIEGLEIAPHNGELQLMMADIEIRKGHLTECFDHLKIGFKEDDVSLSRKLGLMGGLQVYAFEDSDDGRIIQNGLEELYTIIYDEDVKNDTLHAQYGYFLEMQNKPLQAIEQYEKVVDINPNSFDSWMQLVYMQYNVEEYEGMYNSSKKAIELFPEQASIWMLAGISAYETEHFEEAEEWLYFGEGLVVKDPSLSSEFVHQKGKLAWKQKNFEQAHKYFDEAKEIDLYNGNIYHSKALCYADQGEFEKAIAETELALESSPTSGFFHDLKGLILMKAGKLDKAKRAFENALIYEVNNGKFNEHLGDVLFKQGEKDKAIEQWQKAMDLGGYNPTLLKKLNDKTYYEQ